MEKPLKLVECPRDAMQGIDEFIPTEKKIAYHNLLLKCGFHTLDFGSFVSPKAIPQLADTTEVLDASDYYKHKTELLAIVGNLRGAMEACKRDEIYYLGFPFSVSQTFLERNINSSIEDSLRRIEEIKGVCNKYGKELVIYISMAFGNPYGEAWDVDVVAKYTRQLINEFEIKVISLSDTIGTSTAESINYLFGNLIPEFPDIEIGAHLHTRPDDWLEKVDSAYNSGCRRFDGAIKGFGGCPMAQDDLVGNMPMENMVQYFNNKNIETGIDREAFGRALEMAVGVFPL
ncbi:MAG: hydroxymethylglutaryl-CoA lyase [Bacteroidota bacterium]